MILSKSEEEQSKGRRFMQCQFQSCGAFQWVEDDAATGQDNKNSPSSGSSSSSSICFQCGKPGHWVKNCPWKETVCPNGCSGVRNLWTSKQPRSFGRKFLKCLTCGKFEWLDTTQQNPSNGNLKVKIEVSLDELCNSFESKCKQRH